MRRKRTFGDKLIFFTTAMAMGFLVLLTGTVVKGREGQDPFRHAPPIAHAAEADLP